MSENSIIALGSNLGNSQKILKSAIEYLKAIKGTKVVSCSSVYHSKPQGPTQPDYLNQATLIETTLSPHQLLTELQRIEDQCGRTRNQRWEARTLDLDIIVYGNLMLNDERLTIPHPRAHKRSFVLQPMAEIAPQMVIPNYGTASELSKTTVDNLVYAKDE